MKNPASAKLFPRNLTARAAVAIVGNPATTRLESGVGNCFPGLEFDHRNLDRRFFPGLIFDFGVSPPRLHATDPADPGLADEAAPKAKRLSAAVVAALDKLAKGTWHLTGLTQGRRSIDLQALVDDGQLDTTGGWRLVRSLTPDQVTIVLAKQAEGASGTARRRAGGQRTAKVRLTHYRRQYLDAETGAISAAYLPGELTQSLCSPWMHDFRDCSCDYWASNHPDIALGADPRLNAGGDAKADPDLAVKPLDWLRADRGSRLPASPRTGDNDGLRFRHYQINKEWTSLDFVLGRRESDGIFVPRREPMALPYPSAKELGKALAGLCGLEHVVALEYLYAHYSLRPPTDFPDERRRSDILFVRHELLGIAVSEMRHLRWANQLLWSLEKTGKIPPMGPQLKPAVNVPGKGKAGPRQLRPLSLDTLEDFIAIERPSGALDGAYARVVATLSASYPEAMLQLARQIVAEGTDHYNRFQEISVVLKAWPVAGRASPEPWLRPVKSVVNEGTKAALKRYRQIIADLKTAYQHGDMEDARHIVEARQAMMELHGMAEGLAAGGVGIPFF